MIRSLLPLFLPALIAAAPAPAMAGRDEVAVDQLVDGFVAAQRSFDAAALARMTAPDYVEISPLGEVDARDRMLGFYTPDKRQPAPEMVLSERSVRLSGGMAVATVRQAYGPVAMRVVYLARRDKAGWRLVSVQYTPIRPPRPS